MKFSKFTLKYLNNKEFNNLNVKINVPKYNIDFNYKTKFKYVSENKNLIESRFLPNEIFKSIIKFNHFKTIQFDNIIVNLYGNQNDLFFKKQIKFLLVLASINKFFSNKTNNKNKIIVSIYFSEFNKFITKDIISPININSGLTFNKNNIKNIIIFRFEEWKKVFIHELIHAYNIDNYKNITVPFIKGNDMKYESLTEFITLIIHSQMISHLTDIEFNDIISSEIKFSILQSRKLFYFWNITKFNDFYEKNIVSTSSPFSYFIFKTELFLNYNLYKKKLESFELPEIDFKNFFPIFIFNIPFYDNSLRMSLYDLQ